MASNPACVRFERRLVRKAKKQTFLRSPFFVLKLDYYFNYTKTFSAFKIGIVIGTYIRAASLLSVPELSQDVPERSGRRPGEPNPTPPLLQPR